VHCPPLIFLFPQSLARVREASKYVTLLCFYQYEHGRWNESIHDAPDIFKCCYYLESIPNDRPEGLKTNADIFTKIEEASDVNSLANQFVFPFPFPGTNERKFVPRKLQFGQRRKCYKGGLQEQWNFLLKQAIDHLKVISKKSLSFAGLRLYVEVHWKLLEGEKSRMCPRSIADLTINPPSVEQDDPRVVGNQLALVQAAAVARVVNGFDDNVQENIGGHLRAHQEYIPDQIESRGSDDRGSSRADSSITPFTQTPPRR
jgi:hypothetical protein